MIDVIEMEEKKTTCLVLEYVTGNKLFGVSLLGMYRLLIRSFITTGGELFDYIVTNKRLKEAEAIKFFRQMVSALEYCHNNLVIHRGTFYTSSFSNNLFVF